MANKSQALGKVISHVILKWAHLMQLGGFNGGFTPESLCSPIPHFSLFFPLPLLRFRYHKIPVPGRRKIIRVLDVLHAGDGFLNVFAKFLYGDFSVLVRVRLAG